MTPGKFSKSSRPQEKCDARLWSRRISGSNRHTQIGKAILDRGDLGEVYHRAASGFPALAASPRIGRVHAETIFSGGGWHRTLAVTCSTPACNLLGEFDVIVGASAQTFCKFGPRGWERPIGAKVNQSKETV